MTAVFAAQGWGEAFGIYPVFHTHTPLSYQGQLIAAVVSTVVLIAYKPSISHDDPSDPRHVDSVWRFLIGLGCIPAAIALYFRLTIPETPRFTMDIERNVGHAYRDASTFLTPGTLVPLDPDAVVQRATAPMASRRDFMS